MVEEFKLKNIRCKNCDNTAKLRVRKEDGNIVITIICDEDNNYSCGSFTNTYGPDFEKDMNELFR